MVNKIENRFYSAAQLHLIACCIFSKLQMPRSCLFLHNSDPEIVRCICIVKKVLIFTDSILRYGRLIQMQNFRLELSVRIIESYSQQTRNRKWLPNLKFFLILSQRTVTLTNSGQSRITAFGRHGRLQWLSKSTDFDEIRRSSRTHRRKGICASLLFSHGHNYYVSKHKWIFWCSQSIY